MIEVQGNKPWKPPGGTEFLIILWSLISTGIGLAVVVVLLTAGWRAMKALERIVQALELSAKRAT